MHGRATTSVIGVTVTRPRWSLRGRGMRFVVHACEEQPRGATADTGETVVRRSFSASRTEMPVARTESRARPRPPLLKTPEKEVPSERDGASRERDCRARPQNTCG